MTVFACTALIALGAAGCGDDESTDSGEDTSTTSTSTTDSSTTSEPTTSTSTESSTTSTESTTNPDDTGLPKERCKGAESPPNIVNVISYGTDCGAVEAAMAEIQSVSKNFRIGDFECSRRSGGPFGGVWECKGEASYFIFDFAD